MEHSHGGSAPVQTRSERFRSYDVGDFAPVTGREAEWKYTPVSSIANLVEGPLEGGKYPVRFNTLPGVTAEWISADDPRVGSAGKPEDRVSANAWSQRGDVLLVRVEGDVPEPFIAQRSDLGNDARSAHTLVVAEPRSRATVIFRSTGAAQLSENVEIIVGEGAELTVVSVHEWNTDARHVASHFANIRKDASLKHITVTLSGGVVRVNPSISLAGEGANGEAFGLYYSGAEQHCENQVFVHHVAPRTRSRVNYKGALCGENARGVWIGDVLIGRDAAGTDSYEQNRNLIIGDGPRADSVPNLEIETGDIEGAGHASATGRFDDEQLFYLQARGISEDEARRLVVLGFLTEIVQQIGSPELEDELQRALERKLEAIESRGA